MGTAAGPRSFSAKPAGTMRLLIAVVLVLAAASAAAAAPQLAAASVLDLTLLHINDMHARYEETNKYSGSCSKSNHDQGLCYGGYARVATLIKEARAAEHVNTLVLNAGDNFQGTVYYSIFKWNISASFNNLLGFDATTLGNHEFDDHVQGLVPYLQALKNPVVIANADFSKEPTLAALNIKKSVVVERSGVKIGVIGYLTPETSFLSSPDGVTFTDEVTALKEESERLLKEGVNIIIGLGHSGYEVDKKIAAQVPAIDVVVGGHSHSFLYTGTQPDTEVPVGLYPTWITQEATGKKVPVVQAYAFTKYMGKLLLSFDADGNLLSCEGKPVLLNKDVIPDPDTQAEVERWKSELDVKVLEPVGRTEVLLDGTACRQKECNIGNLITDAMVFFRAEQSRSLGWTDAPIALANGGSIRTSIDASSVGGNVTLKDILEVMPFDNMALTMKIRGAVLRQALEHSVAEYIPGQAWKGAFLQMSGIHVEYDVHREAGSRVVAAEVRCGNCNIPQYSPLDDGDLYTIIVNAFLANGGDGFSMLATNEGSESLQETDSSIVEYYLRKQSPVYTGIEGRIQFVGGDLTTTPYSASTTESPTTLPSPTPSPIHWTTPTPAAAGSASVVPGQLTAMVLVLVALWRHGVLSGA